MRVLPFLSALVVQLVAEIILTPVWPPAQPICSEPTRQYYSCALVPAHCHPQPLFIQASLSPDSRQPASHSASYTQPQPRRRSHPAPPGPPPGPTCHPGDANAAPQRLASTPLPAAATAAELQLATGGVCASRRLCTGAAISCMPAGQGSCWFLPERCRATIRSSPISGPWLVGLQPLGFLSVAAAAADATAGRLFSALPGLALVPNRAAGAVVSLHSTAPMEVKKWFSSPLSTLGMI